MCNCFWAPSVRLHEFWSCMRTSSGMCQMLRNGRESISCVSTSLVDPHAWIVFSGMTSSRSLSLHHEAATASSVTMPSASFQSSSKMSPILLRFARALACKSPSERPDLKRSKDGERRPGGVSTRTNGRGASKCLVSSSPCGSWSAFGIGPKPPASLATSGGAVTSKSGSISKHALSKSCMYSLTYEGACLNSTRIWLSRLILM
mmetsp:Transcript_115872/g.322611  ORF Transcript_115872/g.322611 Transcript_115872/m.322611 type:complete len:204 (-) Transcript_115872:459-1070(-)